VRFAEEDDILGHTARESREGVRDGVVAAHLFLGDAEPFGLALQLIDTQHRAPARSVARALSRATADAA